MKPTGGPVAPPQPLIASLQPQTGGYPQQGSITVQQNTYSGNYGNLTQGTVTFPHPPAYSATYTHGVMDGQGLTIRDHFASQALVGFMLWEGAGAQAQFSPTEIAKRCFAVADAMLEERARE